MWSTRRPAPFSLLSTGHGAMIVNCNDRRMVGGGGYGVSYQLFNQEHFDPDEVELVLSLLARRRSDFGSGVIALDCGANLGVHTIEWARLMHDWGQVLSIEAQEHIYYALAGNVVLNNCFNVRAIHAAVGASVGVISVPQLDFTKQSSFGSLELRPSSTNEDIGQNVDYSEAGTRDTPLVSIDSFGLPRLDFIKIDVEGMELEVLAGAEESIKRYHPQLLIEIIKTDQERLKKLLDDSDYETFACGINLLALHRSDPATSRLR